MNDDKKAVVSVNHEPRVEITSSVNRVGNKEKD